MDVRSYIIIMYVGTDKFPPHHPIWRHIMHQSQLVVVDMVELHQTVKVSYRIMYYYKLASYIATVQFFGTTQIQRRTHLTLFIDS